MGESMTPPSLLLLFLDPTTHQIPSVTGTTHPSGCDSAKIFLRVSQKENPASQKR